MRKRCDKCGDALSNGDEYYLNEDGLFCPDCFDWMARHVWLRTVGDVIDRV